MTFTAKDVMTLRRKTGLGMMNCKKALNENNGDLEAAEAWMRENLKEKMDTRTERTTGEGRIGLCIKDGNAIILEVQTETDFTARNDNFIKGVEEIVAIAETMPEGVVEANDDITKHIDDLRISTGENVNYARGEHLVGECFGGYLHFDGKRAAVVQVAGGTVDASTLKGICQHIVFHDPLGISADDVPEEKIAQIRADAIQEAQDTGKPEEIAQKIAEGRVRKHLEENTLLHQKYLKDETKAVKELLPSGVSITRFIRYTLGA